MASRWVVEGSNGKEIVLEGEEVPVPVQANGAGVVDDRRK